jgi:hypothetical protein
VKLANRIPFFSPPLASARRSPTIKLTQNTSQDFFRALSLAIETRSRSEPTKRARFHRANPSVRTNFHLSPPIKLAAAQKQHHRAPSRPKQSVTEDNNQHLPNKMAKLKKQATPAPDPKATRDKPTATPRPRGISRATTGTKHGKNHRLTLKQRNVVRCLMSPAKLNMSPTQESTVFNYIFRNRSLTPKMLREDWPTRKNKKGGNMYIDRIIKCAGTFTREEIVAGEEAVSHIRNACDRLEIELPEDFEMDEDMGDPTDATVLHPTAPLSRLPRGIINGEAMALGYQPEPDNYVKSSDLWQEDDTSFRRRVAMCPGEGVHTRRQVNQYVPRTPSVEPRVVRNTFVPVAPGDSKDSDLEGQAEERRIQRTQSAPAEQQRYADEQARRDRARQKRGIMPQGRTQPRRTALGRIVEHDEEEDSSEDDGNDSDEEEDENNDGHFNAVDAEQDAASNHESNPVDLEDDEETVHGLANPNMSDSGSGELELVPEVADMAHQFEIISVSEKNDPSRKPSIAEQRQQIKGDQYVLPVLKAMLKLPHEKRVECFRAAFPKLKEHEVKKFHFRSSAEIKDVWHLHRNHDKIFDLDDALKSSDSPLSPSHVPRLRVYHRFVVSRHKNGIGYNRPAPFSAIPPTEDIYKCGGPIMRVAVANPDTIEDIMICNHAFCFDCASEQSQPPTCDPDYNLHGMPFIHAKYMNKEDMSIFGASGLTYSLFEASGLRDLTALPEKALRDAEPLNILFLGGYRRNAIVCDPEKCEKCNN